MQLAEALYCKAVTYGKMENVMAVKYVFVTGGMVSGPGKGITAASPGRLQQATPPFQGICVCGPAEVKSKTPMQATGYQTCSAAEQRGI